MAGKKNAPATSTPSTDTEDVMVIKSRDGMHDLILRPTITRLGAKIYTVDLPGCAPRKSDRPNGEKKRKCQK